MAAHDGPDAHRLRRLATARLEHPARRERPRGPGGLGDGRGHRGFAELLAECRGDHRTRLPESCVGESEPAHSIDVFNRGTVAFDFRAETDVAWLSTDPPSGTVEQEQRLWLAVDWDKAPEGTLEVPITVRGPDGTSVVVRATVKHPDLSQAGDGTVFVECSGAVSTEAEHYTREVTGDSVEWQVIPEFGRTLSGVMPTPVTDPRQRPGGDGPRLEYRMLLSSSGEIRVRTCVAPIANGSARQIGGRKGNTRH